MQRAVLAADALLAGEHVERLGARVAVDGRDAAGRAAGVVDAQQVLRGLHAGDRADLGDLGGAAGGGAAAAEGEQPGLAGGFGDEAPGAGEGFGLGAGVDRLDAPVEVAGGEVGDVALGEGFDLECWLGDGRCVQQRQAGGQQRGGADPKEAWHGGRSKALESTC